ncbi:MAG: RNA pseudouridine synthase [Deltaproteobacteria bacterium]|nr:RNA pseudouridine synthase [Deltaproteobacteria bacterium]
MAEPIILEQSDREAVVFKPAGISVQLGRDTEGVSLEARLKKSLGRERLFFPHRLDRITSGLLLVAFDRETVAYYNEEIRSQRIGKYYLARSESLLENPGALIGIQKRFLRVEGQISRVVRSGGLPSLLEILEVEKAPGDAGAWQVLIRLITGRMHQIRVMLADLGLPLAGDPRYNPGSKGDFYLESILLGFTAPGGEQRRCFWEGNPGRPLLAAPIRARLAALRSGP